MPLEERLAQATELLVAAKYGIALTGAGVSTPSGIPDFRSPGSGIWERVDPYQVASLQGFRRRPESFFQWVRPMLQLIRAAQPNAAHRALARLESLGVLHAIITQNIDGLHTAAGSQRVIELHGHVRTATCIRCYRPADGAAVMDELSNGVSVPLCPACGGVLKPDVILFGEQPPAQAVYAAVEEVRRCDLMIVAGSSLVVEPAAYLPLAAKEMNAHLILVNWQPTRLDGLADLVIHADVAEVLPQLLVRLEPEP